MSLSTVCQLYESFSAVGELIGSNAGYGEIQTGCVLLYLETHMLKHGVCFDVGKLRIFRVKCIIKLAMIACIDLVRQ